MADIAMRRQSARGAPRGEASEGYRARVRNTLSDNSASTTLCGLSKNKENISKGISYLQGYPQGTVVRIA